MDLSRPRWLTILWFAVLSTVLSASYGAGLNNPFVYDDVFIIEHNAFIRKDLGANQDMGPFLRREITSQRGFRGHFRPLPMYSFQLNFMAGGIAPWGYRVANLVLHLLCAFLVYLVARRILLLRDPRDGLETRARLGGLCAATAFALHPLNSLAMLLVWKRTTLFAAVFFLTALWSYLKLRGFGGERPGRPGRLACGLAVVAGYFLALSSKETAITLPLLLLLLEVWAPTSAMAAHGGWWRVKTLAPVHLPLWLGVVVWLTVLFPEEIHQNAAAEAWPYLLTQAKVIWFYLSAVIAPHQLAAAYTPGIPSSIAEPSVLLGGAGIVGLLVMAVVTRRRAPLLGLMILWILVTLSPTSSFVPGPLLVDEDRTYIPFIGIWILAGAGLARCLTARRAVRLVAAAGLVALVAALGLTTASRTVTWSNEAWIWIDVLKKHPSSTTAREGLCRALAIDGERTPQAVTVCRQAVAEQPDSIVGRAGLSYSLVTLGRLREAKTELEAGLQRAPNSPQLNLMAGHLAWTTDRPAHALRRYRIVLRHDPWNLQAAIYSAKCNLELGRTDRARQIVQQLEGRAIISAADNEMLSTVHLELGQLQRAERQFLHLLRQHPERAAPLLGLTRVAVRQGQLKKARRLLRRIALPQASPTHRLSFAELQLTLKQPQLALEVLEPLVVEHPRASTAALALARARFATGDRRGACVLFRTIAPDSADPAGHRPVLAGACQE